MTNSDQMPAIIWKSLKRHPGIARLLVILMALAVWEVAARFFVDPLFLSPPTQVLWSLPEVFGTKGVPAALALTLFELAVAFVLSVVFGLIVGILVGLRPLPHRTFTPIILLLYGIPQITILPIFVLYFGIGAPSKIAFGFTHGFFPIAISVIAGAQNMRPIWFEAARSMGASRLMMLTDVIFPQMVPSLFTGLRLGMTGVLLGVLLAELYVSTSGIGYFTTLFTQDFDPTKLFGLIGILAAMAITLNEIVRSAERKFGRWRE